MSNATTQVNRVNGQTAPVAPAAKGFDRKAFIARGRITKSTIVVPVKAQGLSVQLQGSLSHVEQGSTAEKKAALLQLTLEQADPIKVSLKEKAHIKIDEATVSRSLTIEFDDAVVVAEMFDETIKTAK